jgi:hypothetical protein
VKAPEKSGAFSRLMSAGVHPDTVESSRFGGIFDGIPPKQLFGYHQYKQNPPIYPLCRSPPLPKSKNYKEKQQFPNLYGWIGKVLALKIGDEIGIEIRVGRHGRNPVIATYHLNI